MFILQQGVYSAVALPTLPVSYRHGQRIDATPCLFMSTLYAAEAEWLTMQERFDIELDESWVVELDSSSPSKFSRHLVIAIPGSAFQSNFHVGAFVKDLCEVPSAAKCPDEDKVPRQELLINKVCTDLELFHDGPHSCAYGDYTSAWHDL